jgi:hypothetical protein
VRCQFLLDAIPKRRVTVAGFCEPLVAVGTNRHFQSLLKNRLLVHCLDFPEDTRMVKRFDETETVSAQSVRKFLSQITFSK